MALGTTRRSAWSDWVEYQPTTQIQVGAAPRVSVAVRVRDYAGNETTEQYAVFERCTSSGLDRSVVLEAGAVPGEGTRITIR
jgi:hypothetical protein